MSFQDNITVSPYYPNEETGYATPASYQWPVGFEPSPCSCDYSGRHTWLRHRLRLRFMKRQWGTTQRR